MNSNKRLPDVIFIGPLKTATSYIYDYYLHHPNVATSEPVKELYYYDDHYEQGEDWYLKHFSPNSETQVMIDVSPSYLIDDNAMQRIKKDNPNAKIIMTLRDPMERFSSHVKHHIRHGYPYTGFTDLLEEHPRVIQGSQYETYVDKWIEEFGEDKVFVLDYRELTQDSAAFMEKICKIMDVPFNENYEFSHKVNPAGTARSPLLMRLMHIVMRFLIRNGLSGVIDFIKSTGAKKLVFKEGTKFSISEEDIEKASKHFSSSTKWYNDRFKLLG